MEAELFYAGNYAAIVRKRVDAGAPCPPPAELPFVVGALAFMGRLEEARALFSSALRRGAIAEDETPSVAARFFLGVAYCRAGRLEEARREFMQNARARHGSALARFYLFQGFGCYRYFTGRLRKAALSALRALEQAFIADFPYGRLLATDLRGHTLVQLGQIQHGLSLLETARTLADALALPGNAGALRCAIAVYRARFGLVPIRQAIGTLEALAGDCGPEDSYSERSVLLELAVQTALAGDGDSAWRMLDRLRTERIPDGGDARARIRFLLACTNVMRLRHGAASMQPFLSEAHAILANSRDIALEIDVLCMDLIAAPDLERAARVRAELRALREQSGIERRWFLSVARAEEPACEAAPGAEVLDEDRLGALYAACGRASPELALRLLDSSHLGLVPLALGLTPGRRLLVLGKRLVVEDHGNVKVIGEPSEGMLRFLLALADGALHAKEELLAVVWGIACYRPVAHDPVIHTAVSRLRARFGVLGDWLEAVPGGYRLARGVEVVNPFETAPLYSIQSSPPKSGGVTPRASFAPAERAPDAVLAVLAQNGASSSRDVASRLGVSEMTALRRLRQHVENGAIRRDGKGKSTRYRLLRSVS